MVGDEMQVMGWMSAAPMGRDGMGVIGWMAAGPMAGDGKGMTATSP